MRRISERLTRLMAKEQKPINSESEGSNNDAAPRAVGHDPGNSADRDDDQPNCDHTEFVHGRKDSTTEAIPHVVTAFIAKRPDTPVELKIWKAR